MSSQAPFTQADVKRVAKAALDAGLNVREVIVTAAAVRVICGTATQKKADESSSWDELIEKCPTDATHTQA